MRNGGFAAGYGHRIPSQILSQVEVLQGVRTLGGHYESLRDVYEPTRAPETFSERTDVLQAVAI